LRVHPCIVERQRDERLQPRLDALDSRAERIDDLDRGERVRLVPGEQLCGRQQRKPAHASIVELGQTSCVAVASTSGGDR